MTFIVKVLKKIPDSWEWIALIDYNVQFENERWIIETEECLRENRIVQLFETSREMYPNNEKSREREGLVKHILSLQKGKKKKADLLQISEFVDGGRAWAFRRDFFTEYEYFIDIFVSGYEETLFSLCIFSLASEILQNQVTPETLKLFCNLENTFKREINQQTYIKGNINVITISLEKYSYTLLKAINLLNRQISNLYTDNSSMIHVRNQESKAELKHICHLLL